ncbi:penicillin-binding protein 1A [Variibacter gotjawalensis]|uniref:Penicillin-binding protein 1A n=1 Tax=Variibacter gotjawalensis TaxID=1333996 RepID=A0A0S3PY52_9BRAD|nr:penicillin-binding protein 1A [Variibacter gotjawalensis]NIK46704.1 penicillin-binding protein 1A [Variibacter gotjawalensis]RZS48607.1 penicillin-binding protein 1A [Variibacter gotjawalensis]BAT60869.1 penicillin-binding protein 1A [Variibacter gotjawalensis]
MKLLLRFFGWAFAVGSAVFLVGVVAVAGAMWHFSKELPDYSTLQDYEPPVMTRVHASDGSLVSEFARERRLYLPIQAVPKLVVDAFLSAEDKNFYEHGGIDFTGIARAAVVYAQNMGTGRRPQGASTITQQVAKNFLLTNEQTFDRKIKEALLAMKIERAYTKDRILELYLNEIYLGLGAYGIAAASLIYYDKSVHELSIAEAAYLAALPKAPSTLHPFRQRERATERRNYVIDRMVENGNIKAADAEKAKKEPLNVTPRPTGAHIFAAEYFAEEVRREVYERFGEKKLYEGGLSVRATLDPKLQAMARKALADGLVKYDETTGYRGPVNKIVLSGDWGTQLAEIKALNDIPWKLAVVLETGDQSARIGLQPGREAGGLSRERNTGIVPLDGVRWARGAAGSNRNRGTPGKVSQVLEAGDVIYVEPLERKTRDTRRRQTSDRDEEDTPAVGNLYRLRQVPEVSGAISVLDPFTGRVLALVGGFSYDQSQFNRATQALRQPGSSFKPLVYAAALDNGYTPSSIVVDGPLEVDMGNGQTWRPENYSQKFYGPQTLRFGIEQSKNAMTVRLAQDVGMPLVVDYAKRFGVYDDMPQYLSFSLGAGETTVLRMTAAYSMFANGGRRIKPTLIDRIQDRYGHTIFRHDQRECRGCTADAWKNQPEPSLVDRREQVLDPMTAYQITSMMEGVVQRGTAPILKEVGKPIAGKTGTTNDWKDAWFVGFSSDLAVGVYVGYDKPRTLGTSAAATGGHLAAPVVKDFLKAALANKPAVPFRVPPGMKLIRVDARTGVRASGGDGRVILEAFKPGTAPPEAAIAAVDPEGRPESVTPEADRAVRGGGLY